MRHVHHFKQFRDDEGQLWLWCLDCGQVFCWTMERDSHIERTGA